MGHMSILEKGDEPIRVKGWMIDAHANAPKLGAMISIDDSRQALAKLTIPRLDMVRTFGRRNYVNTRNQIVIPISAHLQSGHV
jgi:hypothetical protein